MSDVTEAPVKDGIVRIVLTTRGEYSVLLAELIKDGKPTTLAIDRHQRATRKNISDLRREGIRIARAKRVRFADEITLSTTERKPYGNPPENVVLANDHACVRP
jgi:hypothetical protein